MPQHMVFNFVLGSSWGPGDGSQEKFRGSSAQPISTAGAWMSLAYWSGSLASLGTLPVSVVSWHAHHPFSVRVHHLQLTAIFSFILQTERFGRFSKHRARDSLRSHINNLYADYILIYWLVWTKVKSLSHVRFFATPWTVASYSPTRLLQPWDSLGKNTGVGCHFLLQGIFPDPGIEQVSRIAGRCFNLWATREALV